MIVGTYLHLEGGWLLLVTTPAAIIALAAGLFILAMENPPGKQKDGATASDFYAG
jgi:hypothetical protein